MNTHSLLIKLGKLFPAKKAMKPDYIGLMCGKLPQEVNKILLCLDYDEQVHPFALEYRPDLILTHHPFIYGNKKEVLEKDKKKKALYQQVENNHLTIYSMHTNFDAGEKGMNDALASALGLINIYKPEQEKMMSIGELPHPMQVEEFSVYAKDKLKVNYGLLLPYGNKIVKKVGIIGGGGSSYYLLAKQLGCDIYISGDAPHHIRRGVISEEFNYLDLPHEIEKIFVYRMYDILKSFDDKLDIKIIDHEKEPLVI